MIVVDIDIFGNSKTLLTDREKAIEILENTKSLSSALECKTVSSISGGKTSAYMALNYPTDFNVFAVILTSDPNCQIKDKGLLSAIREKCPIFEGSRELDQTLVNILRLEQELGKEITWIWGETLDRIIEDRQMLPNIKHRFCTKKGKIDPIFEWYFINLSNPDLSSSGEIKNINPIEMNIGFRADEPQRVYKMLGAKISKNGYDWSESGSCEFLDFAYKCDIEGKFKGKHRRRNFPDWRIKQTPLFVDNITKQDVTDFWNRKGWIFPEISNCDYCFFHTQNEMIRQHAMRMHRVLWWQELENKTGNTFHKKGNLNRIINGDRSTLFDSLDTCGCTD